MLTKSQAEVLELLLERPYPVSRQTVGGYVCGVSVAALVRRGLVEWTGPYWNRRAKINDDGRLFLKVYKKGVRGR